MYRTVQAAKLNEDVTESAANAVHRAECTNQCTWWGI